MLWVGLPLSGCICFNWTLIPVKMEGPLLCPSIDLTSDAVAACCSSCFTLHSCHCKWGQSLHPWSQPLPHPSYFCRGQPLHHMPLRQKPLCHKLLLHMLTELVCTGAAALSGQNCGYTSFQPPQPHQLTLVIKPPATHHRIAAPAVGAH